MDSSATPEQSLSGWLDIFLLLIHFASACMVDNSINDPGVRDGY